MESYIRRYYDVLDKEFCKTLIEKFNECEGNQLPTLPKEGRQFTEIALMENMSVFEDEFDACLNSFQNVIEKYKEDLGIRSINSECSEGTSALWPEKYGMEGIKIKRSQNQCNGQLFHKVNKSNNKSCYQCQFIYW